MNDTISFWTSVQWPSSGEINLQSYFILMITTVYTSSPCREQRFKLITTRKDEYDFKQLFRVTVNLKKCMFLELEIAKLFTFVANLTVFFDFPRL